MQRCKWKNLENSPIYIEYHDNEWSVPSYNDEYLFEMLVLESFHCGLSWLLILKKREYFRKAFDDFDAETIANYDQNKIDELLLNANIVRNKSKILATIKNAKAYLKIKKEYNSFSDYIWSFTDNQILYAENDEFKATNWLSDKISKDLKKRGFAFMGSVTTYSYLEAIGVMNNHASYCCKYKKEN